MMPEIAWVELANLAIAAGGLTAALLGLMLTRLMPYMGRWNRQFFTLLFSLVIAYAGSVLMAQISLSSQSPAAATVSRVAIFLESAFSGSLMPLLCVYLLRCAHERLEGNILFRLAIALWGVYMALLVAVPFGDAIYSVSASNDYQRGPLYPLLLVPPLLLMALVFTCYVWYRGKLTRRQAIALRICAVAPLACILIQMLLYGLLMVLVGISVSTLVLFALILADQYEAYLAQRERQLRQQMAVMSLQMRPHFIYNVLSSIYYLCADDPRRAQEVTLDFTNYLRANFVAVTKEGVTPFRQELEHVQAYLAVEQARYGEGLEVQLDCGYQELSLPPLTLQPVVENAVKHGMDAERERLHVSVSTRDDGDAAVIVVSDDGPGFDATQALHPGTALDNVRRRLRAMCRGTLEIQSTTSAGGTTPGGTTVTIRLPHPKGRRA